MKRPAFIPLLLSLALAIWLQVCGLQICSLQGQVCGTIQETQSTCCDREAPSDNRHGETRCCLEVDLDAGLVGHPLQLDFSPLGEVPPHRKLPQKQARPLSPNHGSWVLVSAPPPNFSRSKIGVYLI